jgi:protein-tyrosine phosphatase
VIDTHCHLVPGVDDGPKTPGEAVDLARSLVADGIERVVCTPHFSSFFPTDHEDAARRLGELQGELETLGLGATLAAEVSPGHAVSEPVEELAARSIAGRWVVVEALHDTPATFFEALFPRLEPAGLLPVVAHPERCRALQRGTSLVDWIRRQGGVLQVVAPSLVGRFGEEAAETAWKLVDTGRASLLASDAHGTKRRIVRLREAADLVRRRLGDSFAADLTEHQPALVLAGEAPDR